MNLSDVTRFRQTPPPGLRRVLDAYLAAPSGRLTIQTGPARKAQRASSGPLEKENGAPTSPAVRRPPGPDAGAGGVRC